MIRLILPMLLLAPLAACGSDSEPEQRTATPLTAEQPAVAPPTNPVGNVAVRLRDMPDGQRDVVLFRAVRDANQECQHVTQSTPAGVVNGDPAWGVACDNGRQFIVSVRQDGVMGVTPAS